MKRDFITILALMIALSSCNDDALFEKEMYKIVVALISSDSVSYTHLHLLRQEQPQVHR